VGLKRSSILGDLSHSLREDVDGLLSGSGGTSQPHRLSAYLTSQENHFGRSSRLDVERILDRFSTVVRLCVCRRRSRQEMRYCFGIGMDDFGIQDIPDMSSFEQQSVAQ
jgi:hypothetical protein